MSRSYHQSHDRDFILGHKNYVKFKNKNKIPNDVEYQKDKVIYWKKKKHIAYGELRNFRFHGEPTYAGESYSKNVGEYISPVIEKNKERRKNKIDINSIE